MFLKHHHQASDVRGHHTGHYRASLLAVSWTKPTHRWLEGYYCLHCRDTSLFTS